MQLFTRVRNLLRGAASAWVGRREQRNPEAVYEAAIHERHAQYTTLRGAAAGVLYMRGKLARELERQTGALASVRRQIDLAVDADDDEAALALIERRDALDAEVDRLGRDLTELTAEADDATRNLAAFHEDIMRLREEKVRMLARLTNARARLRLQEALQGLSPDADLRALEGVREHVGRLLAETQLVRQSGDSDLERRLVQIRSREATAGARAQLEEMKRARQPLLPAAERAS
jgi:phage shock protein A